MYLYIIDGHNTVIIIIIIISNDMQHYANIMNIHVYI